MSSNTSYWTIQLSSLRSFLLLLQICFLYCGRYHQAFFRGILLLQNHTSLMEQAPPSKWFSSGSPKSLWKYSEAARDQDTSTIMQLFLLSSLTPCHSPYLWDSGTSNSASFQLWFERRLAVGGLSGQKVSLECLYTFIRVHTLGTDSLIRLATFCMSEGVVFDSRWRNGFLIERCS